jgi:hypothetical protein
MTSRMALFAASDRADSASLMSAEVTLHLLSSFSPDSASMTRSRGRHAPGLGEVASESVFALRAGAF